MSFLVTPDAVYARAITSAHTPRSCLLYAATAGLPVVPDDA